MPKLNDVQSKALRGVIGNHCYSRAVLAIESAGLATVKTTVVPTGGIVYSIDGITYLKANLSAEALTADATQQAIITGQSTFYVQPDGKTVYYVVCLDSSGNERTIQGTYSGQTFTPFGPQTGDGSIPDVGDSLCPIAMMKIATSGATFTPASTALDAAGVTVTYYNLSAIPATAP
jgi:hypothetical protein